MSSPTNSNDSHPVIGVSDSAMLLIDHQGGLFQIAGDMSMPGLRTHATALVKITTLARIPMITMISVPQRSSSPLVPETYTNALHARYVTHKDETDTWDDGGSVKAIRTTGRKTLIIAGTIISVYMAFPVVNAAVESYKAFAMIDTFGAYSKMAQKITLAHVVQAGVAPVDTAAIVFETQGAQSRKDTTEWAEVYAKVLPAYQLLIESYSKVQKVATDNEKLSSQC